MNGKRLGGWLCSITLSINNMKKYKKKPSKLLQIRLAEEEYIKVIGFIKKFNITHREWLLTVLNELESMTIIKDNMFWTDWKTYAYLNTDKWDKKITKDSKCEECGSTFNSIEEWDKRGIKQLERHHYLGYEGDNALKVKILCRPCHWKQPRVYSNKN